MATCDSCIWNNVPGCEGKTKRCDRYFKDEEKVKKEKPKKDKKVKKYKRAEKNKYIADRELKLNTIKEIIEDIDKSVYISNEADVLEVKKEIINGRVYVVKVLKPGDSRWLKIEQKYINV